MQRFDAINWPDGLDAERFLREYWQRQPLFIPEAFPGFENPLPADELGGLACEPEVASRLIIESRGERPWELRQGPFEPALFDWLGTEGWALLVGDLDKLLPDFRHYLQPFRFVPDWRIDDLMASFAPPGGSVGPHFDHYDVFLWQVEGTRTWHIGPEPAGGYQLMDGLDLKIVDSPVFTASCAVKPGDLLYLPPGYLHHGVAESACITWSVGFRAPTAGDLASGWADEAIAALGDAAPLGDAGLAPQADPSEITALARDRLRDAVREALDADDARFAEWLGKHLSDRPADLALVPCDDPAAAIAALRAGRAGLERRAGVRFAHQAIAGSHRLFAGGRGWTLPRASAAALCADWRWRGAEAAALIARPGIEAALAELLAAGFMETLNER